MKKLFVAVMVLALFLPGLASALTYSPTVADLAAWTNISNSSVLNTFSEQTNTTNVKFTGNIFGQSAEPSNGYEIIGKNYASPLNLSAFSTFGLTIYNVNESIWNYSLYVQDNYGWTAVTSPFGAPIAKESNANLQLDLAAQAAGGMDLTNITTIGLYISQIVPIPGVPSPDRTFETVVAPVPEPITMLLLGLGLVGVAGIRRKFKS